MTVTAVERRRRRPTVVDVYVDGELAFQVARDAALKSGLRPGRVIDAAEIERLVAAEARRTALQSAVASLARRPRSERDLRRRLALRKHTPEVIDDTIERLRSASLVDDAQFARSFTDTRDRTSPRGRRLVAGELRAQGVSADVARAAIAGLSDEDAAYRAAARRLRALGRLDYDAFRARLAGYLLRRGFGWDVIGATVRRCWAEDGGAASDVPTEVIE